MNAETEQLIRTKDWMAKSSLQFFKRHPDATILEGVIHISNPQIVKLMSTMAEVILRDSFYINVSARGILTDRVTSKIYKEDELFKSETSISDQFTRVNEWLDSRIKQAQQKLEAAGFNPDSVKRHTKPYETKAATRAATDFYSLLVKADIYYHLLNVLNVAGELSDRQDEGQRALLNSQRECRNQITSVPRKTTTCFHLLSSICKEVKEKRLVARQEQSTRDKQKNGNAKSLAVAQAEQNQLNAGAAPPASSAPAALGENPSASAAAPAAPVEEAAKPKPAKKAPKAAPAQAAA